MAGVGVNLFPDTRHAADWIHYQKIVRPDPTTQKLYEPYYQIYRQLYPDTANTMHQLAQMTI